MSRMKKDERRRAAILLCSHSPLQRSIHTPLFRHSQVLDKKPHHFDKQKSGTAYQKHPVIQLDTAGIVSDSSSTRWQHKNGGAEGLVLTRLRKDGTRFPCKEGT